MSKCILDLDTLEPERDTVRVEGREYEVLTYEDFSLRENARLRKIGNIVLEKMIDPESLETDEDEAQFEEQLDGFLAMVVKGIPEEKVKALPYPKKAALLSAFWKAVANRRTRDATAETGETQ